MAKYIGLVIHICCLTLFGVRTNFNDFHQENNWRDGIVVKASASQSVDLEFISQVESYQKTFKNGNHSFSAWRSAQ